MGAIDIGGGAIDRATTDSAGWTRVSKDNIANESGILNKFQIFVSGDILGAVLKVGTFYVVSDNNLSARSYQTVVDNVTIPIGLNTFDILLNVVKGDYLGYVYTQTSGGAVDRDDSGGAGVWQILGDHINASNEAFLVTPSRIPSIYATGVTVSKSSNIPKLIAVGAL